MSQQILEEEKTETAQAVNTEEKVGAKDEGEVLPAKFKDVNALLNAYNSLQSEFTKRCQKIKELEGKISADKVNAPVAVSGGNNVTKQDITEENKIEIVKGYLKEVASNGQKVILMGNDGVGVKAPVSRPKSIREAGLLAKEIL